MIDFELIKDRLTTIFTIFGEKEQLKKFNEEVYELIDAINCDGSRERITEEMADVIVLLLQFINSYEIKGSELTNEIYRKINRTIERITDGYYNNK